MYTAICGRWLGLVTSPTQCSVGVAAQLSALPIDVNREIRECLSLHRDRSLISWYSSYQYRYRQGSWRHRAHFSVAHC